MSKPVKTLAVATAMFCGTIPAWATPGSSGNPGTVVGNVYESAHLTGFGLAQPSPCGTFAFDPCPPLKPHKHSRQR
ncbi:MAG TPA: hypothetical protein VH206_01880 [Xanthobacteraceae bacterium]|nr:hypothetical protein [Xanthobacteraceae bacterium]